MTGEDCLKTPRPQATSAKIPGAVAPLPLTPLILLTALSVLPVNMILPSLPHIAAAFRSDPALVNLAVAGYAIVTALVDIVAGALSDRYGRRPVALTAIAIFILASLGCALAGTIGIFLLFRALQASIAACFSIALVMIKETSRTGKATSKFGYLAMGWALAPMVGPLAGGLLDSAFGWRTVFLVLAILGAPVLAMSLRALTETAVPSSTVSPSYFAAYRQLLLSPRFVAYSLCMACSMGTLYVFLGGVPLVVGPLLNGSTARLGFYMGMVPAGFILGSYLSGRYGSRLAPGTILIAARLLTCLGLLAGLGLSMLTMQVLAVFAPCLFIGIGNGLTMPAANAGILSVRVDLAGTAAGLAAALSIAGGALIVSIAGLFLGCAGAIHSLFVIMLVPASLALAAAIGTALVDRQR